MKSKNKLIKSAITVIVLILTAVCGYFVSENTSNIESQVPIDETAGNIMSVYFVDVGQGDCEFITFPNGDCMLIDTGEAEYSDDVIEKIQALGFSDIDYLIISHPHTDHMGGAADIINKFEIGDIYMPYATAVTSAYENLLRTISNNNLTVKTAQYQRSFSVSDDITVDFLAPINDSYDDLNNFSAVVKVTYDDSTYLFTGDAESLSENEMLEECPQLLDSDILKVGHHGSKYSSLNGFLYAVTPEYAVVECSKDNPYGHPHEEALKRIENSGAEIYSTAEYGDICIYTNGSGEYNIVQDCFKG